MRPRCDPVDAAAIRLAIERGETNERAAYRAYAATAARPYARSSFTIMLKARQSDIGALRVHRIFDPAGDGTTYWRDRTPIKPPILVISDEKASLRVRAGALHVASQGASALVYEPRAVKPFAIVLMSWGGYLTIEALRFCATHKIAVVILDWERGFHETPLIWR